MNFIWFGNPCCSISPAGKDAWVDLFMLLKQLCLWGMDEAVDVERWRIHRGHEACQLPANDPGPWSSSWLFNLLSSCLHCFVVFVVVAIERERIHRGHEACQLPANDPAPYSPLPHRHSPSWLLDSGHADTKASITRRKCNSQFFSWRAFLPFKPTFSGDL